MMGRRRAGALKKWLAVLALLAVLGVSVWIILIKVQANGVQRVISMPALQVHVESLQPSEVPSIIEISGFLQPRRTVDLAMDVGGIIATLGHQHGDLVEAGDVIVALDTSLVEADLAQAEAALEQAIDNHSLAQSRLERSQALRDQSANSQDDHDAAVTEALTAEALVRNRTAMRDLQRVKLDLHTLNAPLDGVLSDLDVEVGSHVFLGEVLGTLNEIAVLEVTLYVATEVREGLALGDEVDLWMDHDPTTVHTGKITRLGQVADAVMRKFEVETRIDNADASLLAGAAVVCRLTTGEPREALLVPKEWVVNRSGVRGVFSVMASGETEGVLQMTPVEVRTVWTEPGMFEITEGVGAGTRLVVERFGDLRHGQVIEPLGANE